MSAHERSVPEWLRVIQLEWDLKSDQLARLLQVSPDHLEAALANPGAGTLPIGLENAAPLIAIYRQLEAKFPTTEARIEWLFAKNADFMGQPPIAIARSSAENLHWVAYYLDSAAHKG